MLNRILRAAKIVFWSCINPRKAFQGVESAIYSLRAVNFAKHNLSQYDPSLNTVMSENLLNPLKSYFNTHTSGNGIWKWDHYFDIYNKHFEKFRGKEINIVEVGVYSGGSLEMWRNYFGPMSTVYGIDIQPECKLYEKDGIKIYIGDQSDRSFWRKFKTEVKKIDIIIDDGGHQPEQQIVTLEEILPALSPGGVYLCEDVHGNWNRFSDYISGLQKQLNHQHFTYKENLSSLSNEFQKNISSIHSYPFAFVIEKNLNELPTLFAPKHGTKWEPFL